MPLTEEQQKTILQLGAKLIALNVLAKLDTQSVISGPIITIYKVYPLGNTKVSQLEALASDFAVTLGVEDVLVQRASGENFVGISVPNRERTSIDFLKCCQATFTAAKDGTKLLPMCLGQDILGNLVIEDLTQLPHLLGGGSTGAGKSTLLNSLIGSFIYTQSPKTLRICLSDTKQVEFGRYIGVPHLIGPPHNSVEETYDAMIQTSIKVEERLQLFARNLCKNIQEFNTKFPECALPRILFVIDELADLMMCDVKIEKDDKLVKLSKLCESMILKLVQRTRASGVHFIAFTQRPSVKVVSGDIKANFPARLSFRLPSAFDSKTILGTSGAEHLLQHGDCLYQSPLRSGLTRLHTPMAYESDIQGCIEASQYLYKYTI